MPKKSLKTNAFFNTLKTVLSIVIQLITFPYLTRVLGVDTLGVYDFSNSIISYFLLLAGAGIATYAIREGTPYRNDSVKINKFVSEVFSINLWTTLFSYICLFCAVLFVNKLHDYSTAILILSVEIIFTTIGVNWVCNIFEDFFVIAIQSVGVQLLSLVCILVFVKGPEDLYKYVIIVAASRSVGYIFNFFYIRKKYCKFKFTWKCHIKQHIKPILIIFASAVAITIYVSSDTTMLGFMTDDHQVGLYGTAVKIYTIVKTVLSAVLMVLIPRFALLLQSKKQEEVNRLFTRVVNVLLVFVLPATVGLFMTSQDVVHLLGGEQFLEAAMPLKLLCIAIAFSMLGYMFSQCILVPFKKEMVVFVATAISAAVNIGLNFFFIPWWGINGAAITTIIAEAIVCVICMVASRNAVKLGNITRNTITVVIGCAAIVLVCLLIENLIGHYMLRLLCCILASCLIYIVVLLIGKNSLAIDALAKVRGRISGKKE